MCASYPARALPPQPDSDCPPFRAGTMTSGTVVRWTSAWQMEPRERPRQGGVAAVAKKA